MYFLLRKAFNVLNILNDFSPDIRDTNVMIKVSFKENKHCEDAFRVLLGASVFSCVKFIPT